MVTRARVRLTTVLLLLLCLGTVGQAYATTPTTTHGGTGGAAANGQSVAPRENITVIATDSNTWLGLESDGARANAELVAFAPNGSVYYYNDSHTRYWDVDPVPNTSATVEYLYADHLNASECGGESACTENGIERVNLTTGEVTSVYSRQTADKHSTRWHDGDRLDEERYVIADIAQDRVFVVNTTTGLVEWAWDAQQDYDPRESGGPFPSDWTHLNDVEVLDDGRIMVSLRNHDRVVFLDPDEGLQANQTLGNGSHEVIFEQHNPDYLPSENGSDSVVVADSENNRVVEYQRTDGSWERTWTWRDASLQWPRDADRLPNGHTLVTDSNGDRVLEVDESGEVVWSAKVAFPYEAERLGTGDESAGGPTAREAGLTNRTTGGAADTPENGTPSTAGAGGFFRGPTVNAVMYVLPVWMDITAAIAAVVGVVVLLGWLAAEWRWSPYRIGVRSPLDVTRER